MKIETIRNEVLPRAAEAAATVVKAIMRLAIRILFVLTSVLTTAALVPVSWYSLALPVVALGAIAIAAQFFQAAALIDIWKEEQLPPDAPRGFLNGRMNCAFNSLLQMFQSSPSITNWMRGQGDGELHQLCQRIDADYAKERGAPLTGASELRAIIHQLDQRISASDSNQEDAHELLTILLDAMPGLEKLRATDIRQYANYVGRATNLRPILQVPLHDDFSDLQSLLNRELDHEAGEGDEPSSNYGQVLRLGTKPENAPETLFINLNRVVGEHKDLRDIQIPNELTFPTGNYTLKAFVTHQGTSPHGGHYVAGRVVGDHRYIASDCQVSADPDLWNRSLEQACILCYVRR